MGASRSPSPQTVEISAAVTYEVDMLRLQGSKFWETRAQKSTDNQDIAYRNALLEGFLLHARNLIHFLWGRDKQDDVLASHFFNDKRFWENHRPQMSQFLTDQLLKINKRLTHLTYARLKIDQHWDMPKISKEIEQCLDKFLRSVPPERLSDSFRQHIPR